MCVKNLSSWFFFLLFSAHAVALDLLPYSGEPRVEVPIKAVLDSERIQPVGDKLRIATYNIENFTDGFKDGSERSVQDAKWQTDEAAKIIDSFNPDILVIQEIENRVILNQLNMELENPYGLGFITQLKASENNPLKINLAVLSRVKLSGLRELDFLTLSGKGRPSRGVAQFFLSS